MIKREESLKYHSSGRPGKIEIKATKVCLSPREMRLAYLPGAAFPAKEIFKDPTKVFEYTSRGNLVGVITNGSATPGLGDVGPLAAKPMQEGISVLFKRLADINVYDLEMDASDPDQMINAIKMLEPTFGGINIKDIQAPEGLYIYDKLCEQLNIPVFHENLYSTAIVATAALINALALVEKQIKEIRMVISGAGTVGIGCARLMTRLGVSKKNLLIYDDKGLLHKDRKDLVEYQREFASNHSSFCMAEGLKNADIFIGASAGKVLTPEMIRSMNHFPIVFALATPEPEIDYETAKNSRDDIIVATALGQYPNAILDLLSFPYILRGALDVQASSITENMMLAAARSLAELAREEVIEKVERAYGDKYFNFGPEYLLPKVIDPRILIWESTAVARQAIKDGVAGKKIEDDVYQHQLSVLLGTGCETMHGLIMRAKQKMLKVVFPEGNNETILRACSILMDEEILSPILLGPENKIRKTIDRLGLDLGGASIIDPDDNIRYKSYVNEYFRMRNRNGISLERAEENLLKHDYFAAMMVHSGDADMIMAGHSGHYAESLQTIIEVIGTAPGIHRVSSHYMVLLPKDVVFLADCAVNIEPDAEELAEIALLTAQMSRHLGFDPRVAMLSFSNFGNINHPLTKKVRRATQIVQERAPELKVDGEMQLATARDSSLREKYFSFANMDQNANILIFPDLQSGNLTMHALQHMAEAIPIGPVLMGTRLPAHLIQYGSTVDEIVHLATVGVVEAAAMRHE